MICYYRCIYALCVCVCVRVASGVLVRSWCGEMYASAFDVRTALGCCRDFMNAPTCAVPSCTYDASRDAKSRHCIWETQYTSWFIIRARIMTTCDITRTNRYEHRAHSTSYTHLYCPPHVHGLYAALGHRTLAVF